MADVTAGGAVRDDRGQLILITAVGIASLLVLLALLLNAVIVAESAATRVGHAADAREALDYRIEAEAAVSALLEQSHREVCTDFEANVRTWDDLSASHAARTGASAHVAVTTTADRSGLCQDDATRAVTNRHGNVRWSPIPPADEGTIHAWEMTLSPTTSVTVNSTSREALAGSEAFRIEVAGSTEVTGADGVTTREVSRRDVFVYRENGSTDVHVRVFDESGTGTGCSVADAPVRIDFVGGTVDGDPCFAFYDPATAYSLTFDGSASATGTYRIVVDQPVARANAGGEFNTDGLSPYVVPYVTDASIEVVYATPGMRYRASDVPIVPEASS